jgi:hypothetical protein
MDWLVGQILPLETPGRVAALPAPPLWEFALLEKPIYLAAALLLAAVVAGTLLNQRGRARQGVLIGAGLVALAAGVLILGGLVKTEREQMADATRSLVETTARIDARALERALAPDATLFSDLRLPGVPSAQAGLDKPGIIKAVQAALGAHPLKEYRVLEVQAQSLASGMGRTQARVRVSFEEMPAPHISWWRVDWRRSADGVWRATAITPLDVPWVGAVGAEN